MSVNSVAGAKTSMIVVFASLKRIEAEKCRHGARKVPSWRQKSAVMAPRYWFLHCDDDPWNSTAAIVL
jgi:hypothetical protein